MMYFMVRADPPRSTFAQDMTPGERSIMQRHVAYWTDLMGRGSACVFGPVLDPSGAYGLGVIAVETEEERDAIIAGDPAYGLNRYRVHPMRAVVPASSAGP